MKIIFLEAVQNYGGARMSTLELASRIRDAGHEVLIVDVWGADKVFNEKVHEHELPYKVLVEKGRPFVIASGSKLAKLFRSIWYLKLNFDYRKLFREVVDDFSPDVVCVNNVKCLALLERNSRYRIDFFARTWFSGRKLPRIDKFFLKSYKPKFLAVSQATRQAIYSAGLAEMSDIRVLHSVISESVFKGYVIKPVSFSRDRPIRILHSGGFLESKGQETALLVARQLKQSGIPFHLTLTGVIYLGDASENYYKKIVKLIEDYKLDDFVDLVVNKSSVIDVFRKSDVLIHPSSTEGLPRVALEALSFGKPVIANPVGGVTDVVIHNYTGYLTDFNEVDQYVAGIKTYFDPEIYRAHSDNARALIESSYLDANQRIMIASIYQ